MNVAEALAGGYALGFVLALVVFLVWGVLYWCRVGVDYFRWRWGGGH